MRWKEIFYFLFILSGHTQFSLALHNMQDVLRPDSKAEEVADELLLKGRLRIWELLQLESVRDVMSVFLSSRKDIMEDNSFSEILTTIMELLVEILTDDKKGSLSIRHIFEGLETILVEPSFSLTFKAILDGILHIMQNPNFVEVIHKKFDLATAFVHVYRGPELMMAITDGSVRILKSKDPKGTYIKAFTNMKYHMFTKLRHKVKKYLSG